MEQRRIQLEIGPYLRDMDIREDGKITFPDKYVIDTRTGETLKLPKQAKSYVVPEVKRRNGERGYIMQHFQAFGVRQSYYAHVLSAIAFLGDRRSEGLEVDHGDGDTTNNHYSNLEWITHQENIQRGYARKRAREGGKRGPSITYKGVTRTYEEWSDHLGGSPPLVRSRIRLGWSEEAAVNTPPRPRLTGRRSITYDGVTRTYEEWSKELGGSNNLVRVRLALGWSEEDAVAIPIGGRRVFLEKPPSSAPDITDPQVLATLLEDPDALFPV